MGESLAIEALKTDASQIKEFLDNHLSEVDDDFYMHLEKETYQCLQKGQFDQAVRVLQVFYRAAQCSQSQYHSAKAYLFAALVELRRKRFDRSLTFLQKCLEECRSISDPRALEVEAQANELAGIIHLEQRSHPDKILPHFNRAKDLFEALKRTEDVERLQKHISEVDRSSAPNTPPLEQMLDDILRGREILTRLETEQRERQQRVETLTAQQDKLEKQVQKLSHQLEEIKEKTLTAQQHLWQLESKLQILAVSTRVPLWAALIRAELDEGKLSETALRLLEKMRLKGAREAEALMIEIRARNGFRSEGLVEVDGLSGEQRLFASILNSRTLEAQDWVRSAEVLVEGWETYLKEQTGGDLSISQK